MGTQHLDLLLVGLLDGFVALLLLVGDKGRAVRELGDEVRDVELFSTLVAVVILRDFGVLLQLIPPLRGLLIIQRHDVLCPQQKLPTPHWLGLVPFRIADGLAMDGPESGPVNELLLLVHLVRRVLLGKLEHLLGSHVLVRHRLLKDLQRARVLLLLGCRLIQHGVIGSFVGLAPLSVAGPRLRTGQTWACPWTGFAALAILVVLVLAGVLALVLALASFLRSCRLWLRTFCSLWRRTTQQVQVVFQLHG